MTAKKRTVARSRVGAADEKAGRSGDGSGESGSGDDAEPSGPTGSTAIDQLLSSLLELPVTVRWEGSLAEGIRGRFDAPQVGLAGVATAWLPLERVLLSAREARIEAGFPARLEVTGPSAEIVVAQADVDPWMKRFELPFTLHLEERGLLMKTEVAGYPLGEFQARIEIMRGWFVVRPSRAALMGVPQIGTSLMRAYLPVPPVSDQTRLTGIEHEAGRVRLRFELEDFAEDMTPGMAKRISARMLRRTTWWPGATVEDDGDSPADASSWLPGWSQLRSWLPGGADGAARDDDEDNDEGTD